MILAYEKERNHIDEVISKINEIFFQNKWEKITSSSSSVLVNKKKDENNNLVSNTYSKSNTYSNYPFDKFTINYNYNMNIIEVIIPVVNGDILYKTTFTIGDINKKEEEKEEEEDIYSYIENHIRYYQKRIICL
jgi:hypothetical protein